MKTYLELQIIRLISSAFYNLPFVFNETFDIELGTLESKYLRKNKYVLNSGQMKLASYILVKFFWSTYLSDQIPNPESTNPEFISHNLLFVFD